MMAKQEVIFVIAGDRYVWGDKFKTLKAAQDGAERESDGYDVLEIYECKKVAEAKVRSRLEWK